ncbi:uncharacterized protein L969DRAFT_164292 [Mixia osmundae IAM 14324]|uniref:Uncharacterized protein n=1 Tax=Mixia osmundae (strain CBS 9802 / IAM 14324 / JCM 22182 / KY 12970) TaxID=764103 RepID=G7DX89_MIXOS|nr:uncharacterized protein L969DRAFT_164292 [Mixia osmundae IAM 14324]KEI42638.1 hypothetical protein L969DRAFT_164292 [Mixia osmundae IAM 14324]GAA95199.1 hypothetical protein E5Q_01854 [Mixia osmundae IAM 14324]
MAERVGLLDLPNELLLDIHLLSLSECLPLVNRRLASVLRSSNRHILYYLYDRATPPEPKAIKANQRARDAIAFINMTNTYTHNAVLRYGICTLDIYKAFEVYYVERFNRYWLSADFGQPRRDSDRTVPRPPRIEINLPKRLFRHLTLEPTSKTRSKAAHKLRSLDEPDLALIEYLLSNKIFPADPNINDGYALCRAVHSEHRPLIRLLLRYGALPSLKDNLAITLCIKSSMDLSVLKMLFERTGEDRGDQSLPRPLPDRVKATPEMLEIAAKLSKWEIAAYLRAKGAVPTMKTIVMIQRAQDAQRGPTADSDSD